MEAQHKPEGLNRAQAGVKPLQKRMVTSAPKGRQNTLPPLRGWPTHCLFTGVSPLSVFSTPLRGYPLEMCIKSSCKEVASTPKGSPLNSRAVQSTPGRQEALASTPKGSPLNSRGYERSEHPRIVDHRRGCLSHPQVSGHPFRVQSPASPMSAGPSDTTATERRRFQRLMI